LIVILVLINTSLQALSEGSVLLDFGHKKTPGWASDKVTADFWLVFSRPAFVGDQTMTLPVISSVSSPQNGQCLSPKSL
jgi:hypothetical protein